MKRVQLLITFCLFMILTGIGIAAEDAITYFNKGMEFQKKADALNAIINYNKAIAINRNYKEAYENLGAIYLALGMLKIYKQLNIKEGMAYYDKAIDNYSQVIRLDPKNPEHYIHRGGVYSLKVAHDMAIEDFDQAIRLDPKKVSVYESRAMSYYKKKQYDKAWEDINKLRSMGGKVDEKFLQGLKKDSGREN